MTFKQFAQLAGGALVALLIYATSLPSLIKWPLIIIFVLLGAALAFLPIEERPLEEWIGAFFKSIYSPTRYFWDRSKAPRSYFANEAALSTNLSQQNQPVQKQAQEAPQVETAVISQLNEAEESFLSKVGHLFSAPHTPAQTTSESAEPAPQKQEVLIPSQYFEKQDSRFQQKKLKEAVPTEQTDENQKPSNLKQKEVSEIFQKTQNQGETTKAQFSDLAAPPTPPTQPNIVVGQVLDNQGQIIEGAILEIKDLDGRPVRALRTNKAGHFMIVTPLSNGKYKIFAEKDGYQFESYEFEAKGKIIPPMAIKAKKLNQNEQ